MDPIFLEGHAERYRQENSVDGPSIHANPYSFTEQRWEDWRDGWISADLEISSQAQVGDA